MTFTIMRCAVSHHTGERMLTTYLGLIALTIGSGGPIAKEVVDRKKDGQYVYESRCCYQNNYLGVEILAYRHSFVMYGLGVESVVYSKSDDPDDYGEEIGEHTTMTASFGLCNCTSDWVPYVTLKSNLSSGFTTTFGIKGFHFSQITTKYKGLEHKAVGIGFSLPIY